MIQAIGCLITCDVQVTKKASAVFRRSTLLPYPWDTSATFTRYGAHDKARIHFDQTLVNYDSVSPLGGSGAIAVTWIVDPPTSPPSKGESVEIHGYAAIYSLDPSAGLTRSSTQGQSLFSDCPITPENKPLNLADANFHGHELVLTTKDKKNISLGTCSRPI
jgi:hypothetical protein